MGAVVQSLIKHKVGRYVQIKKKGDQDAGLAPFEAREVMCRRAQPGLTWTPASLTEAKRIRCRRSTRPDDDRWKSKPGAEKSK